MEKLFKIHDEKVKIMNKIQKSSKISLILSGFVIGLIATSLLIQIILL